jgi:hypothetical protein
LQIYNNGIFLLVLSTQFHFYTFRLQELSQLNEKLRLQLAEKEGTISTLSRTNQTQYKVTVSFIFDDTLKK